MGVRNFFVVVLRGRSGAALRWLGTGKKGHCLPAMERESDNSAERCALSITLRGSCRCCGILHAAQEKVPNRRGNGADCMEYIRITRDEIAGRKALHCAFQTGDRGGKPPTEENLNSLARAIDQGQILFYTCADGDRLVGCCSITRIDSTSRFQTGGGFENSTGGGFEDSTSSRHTGARGSPDRWSGSPTGRAVSPPSPWAARTAISNCIVPWALP